MLTTIKEGKHLYKMGIIILGLLLSVFLHGLWQDPIQDVRVYNPSEIRNALGTIMPLLGISLLILFTIVGYTFLWIQKYILVPVKFKAWYYGIPAGGLWVIGMTEVAVWKGRTAILPLFLSGMADLIPILLICCLLGKFFISENIELSKAKRRLFPSILIIPAFYLLGRYFSYVILQVSSGMHSRPLGTFVWTLVMGFWIWVMFFFMGIENIKTTTLFKSLIFGVFIFGLTWTSFNAIGALITSDFSVFLDRTLIDTFSVFISVYLSLKYNENNESISFN